MSGIYSNFNNYVGPYTGSLAVSDAKFQGVSFSKLIFKPCITLKYLDGILPPTKANSSDAGYDLVATTEPKIVGAHNEGIYSSIDYIEYGTSLFVEMPEDFIGHLEGRPRSSLSKYNLVLANSVATIDHDYRGEIKVRFKYIAQPEDFKYLPSTGGFATKVNHDKIYKRRSKSANPPCSFP